MYSCKKVTQLKLQSIQRSLVWRERWGIFMHRLICAGCRQVDKQMAFISRAAHKLAQNWEENLNSTHLSAQAHLRIQAELSKKR